MTTDDTLTLSSSDTTQPRKMAASEDFAATLTPATYDYYVDDRDYYYDEDYESEACNKTAVIHFGSNLTLVIFSVVMVLSLLGNILVILILVMFTFLGLLR
ncbi:chemokine XC receptor 1 [Xyrichtys novacula]|uniref:Chemokine XC receptor 1 n=1 Tax=Xyrichtys novacula TaxID=13765 RepID=A0AAV1GIA2_XYRNO|nr:chemokine XC receptor 1 [Xyrichtys novacula]